MKNNKTIQRLLIANRGEIAVRIMQSAQAMGIHCIALYSDADEHALHVKTADQSLYVGPSPAKDSYLKFDTIIELAKAHEVDAIHPGYGFLSENPHFAQAVLDANMIWIGPPVNAIKAMGSKSESKSIMEKAKVPLVPGYHGDNQDEAFLAEQVPNIGFPVLIKASAGGGGKGMRVVNKGDDILAAIQGAKREGLNSFGDDKLLMERYITQARHVEIQVFLDEHGNGVYLFERDCSIQRRHQKIIEEAPAPDFPTEHRQAMGEAALKAASAINYVGAGTVEFLYDPTQKDSPFYFMEMNTRLQVEHPVTEMITGQDLVAWQIKVAQGEPLPLTQNDLTIHGHAMEVRVYAEDPDNDFLPTTGTLEKITPPTTKEGRVRLDTGVQEGDAISPYYDPMISKLIVWGENREQCLQQLKQALNEYRILGITTNLGYLRRLINIDDFKQGKVNTQFIPQHEQALQPFDTLPMRYVIAAACERIVNPVQSLQNPFAHLQGFRLNAKNQTHFQLVDKQDTVYDIKASVIGKDKHSIHFSISINEQILEVYAHSEHQTIRFKLNGEWQTAHIIQHRQRYFIYDAQGEAELTLYQANFNQQQEQNGNLSAPMNGTIIDVLCEADSQVKAGDALIIMEAMKMEHTIKAPCDGSVKNVFFKQGDLVNEGAALIELDEA